MPFVKLDTGILDSSLWSEPAQTCKCWITLLAMADADGFVRSTAPGIARRANLGLADTETALEIFESPDSHSRTLTDDGRRIKRTDGGYQIVNYEKYRERDYTAAERQKRWREKQKGNGVTPVTRNVTSQRVTQAEAEADKKEKRGAQARPTIEQVIELIGETAGRDFFDYYESNGWRVGRNPMKSWKAAAQRWKRNQNTVNPTRPNFSRPKERAPSYPKMSETRECSDEERERVLKIAAEEKEKLRTQLTK